MASIADFMKIQEINNIGQFFFTDLETLIGNVEVKTRSVHFYVQRNTSITKEGILRFQLARLNVGKAMDLSTGIFTVPVNGIYHFEFSGVRDAFVESAIYLQVNGKRDASSYSQVKTGIIGNYGFLTGVLNASLRLKKGDKVNIFKNEVRLFDNEFFYTHFTGWLVEEDLILP